MHYRTNDYRAQTAVGRQVSWPTGSVMQAKWIRDKLNVSTEEEKGLGVRNVDKLAKSGRGGNSDRRDLRANHYGEAMQERTPK